MQYQGADNLDAMSVAVNYNRWLCNTIIRQIPRQNLKIVDFGAGKGDFARQIKSRSNCDVICVEPAANMQNYFTGLHLESSLSAIKDSSIDIIYSLNVLEHIRDDTSILAQMYQKLRHGGKLILYVPASPFIYSVMDKAVGHYRRYRRSELISKVQNSGFAVKTCYYADSLGWLAGLLYKFLPFQNGTISAKSVAAYDKLIFPFSHFIDICGAKYMLGKNLWLIAEK